MDEGNINQVPQSQIMIQQPKKKNENSNLKLTRNWLIFQLFITKEYDKCKQQIEEIQKVCGENHEFSNLINGQMLRQKGNIPKALDCLKKSHMFNEKNLEVLKHISRTLLLLGKHKASIEVANEAIQLFPLDWELYFTQGQSYLNMKQYEQAVKSFLKAKQLSKHDKIFLELGKLYCNMDKVQEAIDIYKEGLEHSLENTEIMSILGTMYLRVGENKDAFQYFCYVLAIDPKDVTSLLGVSSIMQDKSEYDKSLLRYRIMSQSNPNDANLWNNIGMCFYGKKKFIAAIACIKKSLYLDPFQWITSLNLGLVYYQTEQYASAFHCFSVAINLRIDNATSYMYLGLCLNKLQDFNNSCNAFEKALSIDQQIIFLFNYSNFRDYLIYINYTIILVQQMNFQDKAKQMFLLFEQKFQGIEEDTRLSSEEILLQRDLLSKYFDINVEKIIINNNKSNNLNNNIINKQIENDNVTNEPTNN